MLKLLNELLINWLAYFFCCHLNSFAFIRYRKFIRFGLMSTHVYVAQLATSINGNRFCALINFELSNIYIDGWVLHACVLEMLNALNQFEFNFRYDKLTTKCLYNSCLLLLLLLLLLVVFFSYYYFILNWQNVYNLQSELINRVDILWCAGNSILYAYTFY